MKIVVLLSSYNGEKFIREQTDSILNQDIQETAELQLIVRDDGSSDSTHQILDEYAEKGLLTWYTGDNLKPAKSFWTLVRNAPSADYYAFADQDDVWFKDKLSRAKEMLQREDNNQPLLYMGDFILTDGNLNPLQYQRPKKQTFTDFAHSLVYSTSPGCTLVFNGLARNKMLLYNMELHENFIHDWLAHKIIAMTGKCVLDLNPKMFYRQHGGNVIGINSSVWKEYMNKIDRFLNGRSKQERSRCAKVLEQVYDEYLEDENREVIKDVAHYRNSFLGMIKFMNDGRFSVHSIDDFFRKGLILLGKL